VTKKQIVVPEPGSLPVLTWLVTEGEFAVPLLNSIQKSQLPGFSQLNPREICIGFELTVDGFEIRKRGIEMPVGNEERIRRRVLSPRKLIANSCEQARQHLDFLKRMSSALAGC